MKKRFFTLLVILTCAIFGQDESIPDKQFMVGVTSVGSSEVVRCYIHSYTGALYRYYPVLDSFKVDTDSSYSYDYISLTGNSDTSNPGGWPGWNFSWLYGDPHWNLGVYRVFNSKNTGVYFFLDTRDYSYGSVGYNPDFFILFNASTNKYYYKKENSWTEIPNKSVLKISEIFSKTYTIQRFESWWSNTLCGQYKDNTPLLVWGKYSIQDSVQRFLVEKKIGNGSWLLIDSVSSSTFSYNDSDQSVYPWGNNGVHTIYYRIIPRLLSGAGSDISNTVTYSIGNLPDRALEDGGNKLMAKIDPEAIAIAVFPNPSNPSTILKINQPLEGFVNAKLYDITGKEILTVTESWLKSGIHYIPIDLSNFSSGIYFLRVVSEKAIITQRIILQK